MPRSNKCREWEKERRNRFNEALVSLAKVLPDYDPSVNLPKIDIIHKARTTIVELQAQVAAIINSEEKEAARTNYIKKFQNRIRILINRNKELGSLLKDAKINIPKHLDPIKIKKNLPWAGKIKPEVAEYFQKKEMEKENLSQSTQPSRKMKNMKQSCKKTKIQECRKKNKAIGSKCVVLLPQSRVGNGVMRQGCAILSSAFSKDRLKGGCITSISKPVCISGNALSSLGPGTLIFPNGTALPLVTQSPICLPPTVTFLTSPVPGVQLTASKAVQKASQVVVKQTTGVKKYNRPIIPNICLTTTTQVNKVPIPALSTNYTNTVLLKSAHKTVASKSSAPEENKKCLKRKAATLHSEVTKKSNSEATSLDKNETVDSISTSVSTSNNSTNIMGKNDDNLKVDTANVSKEISESCNADRVMNEKTNVQIRCADGVDINSEQLTDKQDQVGMSDPKTNNLDIASENQVDYGEIVKSQSLMDGKADVLEKTTDLLRPTNIKNLDTATRNELSAKSDIVSAIEESITHIPPCTKDDLPSGISQDTKTDHTHLELSNDIFGALTVGASCQNPESTSPTAAFLMTFPLVSSVKATEVTDEENVECQDTENLLQSSNIDTNKTALPDNLANSLLNLDTFSFFSCSNFLNKCSTALGNENISSNIVPISQADLPGSVSREQQKINEKSDTDGNITSNVQVQCLNRHERHNSIPKETSTIENSTHNEVAIVKSDKNEHFGFSHQSAAICEDKFKENLYNSFQSNNKSNKNSGKLLTYCEPSPNLSHLDIKCVEQPDSKNKPGRINISSSEKNSSSTIPSMLNSQKQNTSGLKDLDSYYHDSRGLNSNNKSANYTAAVNDGNKNISSVKCHEDNIGKNATNFNMPFITQNVFEQNVKDCYMHGRNDSLESRIKIGSSQVPQHASMKGLTNIGDYNYVNVWNLPEADNKLSRDKKPSQTDTQSAYNFNEREATNYNNLAEADHKTTVSQNRIQNRSNVSENTTYSNLSKSDSKQYKSREHIQNFTKSLYDFNVSEAMTYSCPDKSNVTFCNDKNTISVSHQSVSNPTKYSMNVPESSGNKDAVAPRQAIQNTKKSTYGLDIPNSTSNNMYPNTSYDSTSINVSGSYIIQNMPVISKSVITPSPEYRSTGFDMHPTNVPLSFGSNHYGKVTNSLCDVKSTNTIETLPLSSGSDSKKLPEMRDSMLQLSALQSKDNVHCGNIFEDKNIALPKHLSGASGNTLQYSLKTREFRQNDLYTNYQQVTGFQSRTDNRARMTDIIYPERISSTTNNRLPNINVQHAYDKKQSSQVYHNRGPSKDDKQSSISTLNQDVYGKKHLPISREKHGDNKNNPDEIMKKSNSALQHDVFYKEKTKNTIRNMNKVSNDIFAPQTTINTGNQSNKDNNQASQLYMMNLPGASCHYQTEDAKVCSYMNINKSYSGALYTNSTNYRYNCNTTDVGLNQTDYKPATSKTFGQDKVLDSVPSLDTSKYCSSPVKKPGSELKSNPFNPPVNWMTTADSKTECLIPHLSTPSYTFASTDEAKQYTWSTTKFPNIFEPPQPFVTQSMPSLPFNTSSLIAQKPKEKKTIQPENSSNFLSVSQLVDHKNGPTSGPARVTARRNSGNRSKSANPNKNRRTLKTDSVDKSTQSKQSSGFIVDNEFCYEQKQSNRNRNSTSYSAEALIGNQGNDFSNKKSLSAESKSLVTTNFLADSMVTYFPSMDDNYISHNNFPNNNFTHNFQSTTYSTNNFLYSTPSIAPTHAPTNTFETPQDFLSENIAEMKDFNTKHIKLINKDEKYPTCNNISMKKSKNKQLNESNSFETTFPPVNETSILNEDFLHNTFLPPTTPYPCKTNFCQKQSNELNVNSLLPLPGLARSFGQSVESSPSLNTAGTSLTNFNLSAIFPEINKVSFSSEPKYNYNT